MPEQDVMRLLPDLKRRVSLLDATVKSGHLKQDLKVFRGGWMPQQAGVRFKDQAFVSTSMSAAQARHFTNSGRYTVWEITVPSGTNMAIVRTGRGADSEKEILLPRGCVFRVTRVTTDTVYATVEVQG